MDAELQRVLAAGDVDELRRLHRAGLISAESLRTQSYEVVRFVCELRRATGLLSRTYGAFALLDCLRRDFGLRLNPEEARHKCAICDALSDGDPKMARYLALRYGGAGACSRKAYLREACLLGNVSALKLLLRLSATTGEEAQRLGLLQTALNKLKYRAVAFLGRQYPALSLGSNPLLHLKDAANFGSAKGVRVLRRLFGVSAECARSNGNFVLLIAFKTGRLAAVRRLRKEFELTAEDARSNGCSALGWACEFDQLGLLHELRHGFGLTYEDAFSVENEVLRSAGLAGRAAVVESLCKLFGLTAEDARRHLNHDDLCAVSERGHLAVLQSLYRDYKLTAEDFTRDNNRAFRSAWREGRVEVVQWLRHTFEISLADLGPLAGLGFHPALVRFVHREFGVAPDSETLRDLLQTACRTGDLEALRALREEFELTAADVRGGPNLALIKACQNGHDKVVLELRRGFGLGISDVLRRHDYQNAVEAAWGGGHLKVLQCLRSEYGVPDAVLKWGRHHLHDLARAGAVMLEKADRIAKLRAFVVSLDRPQTR